MQAPAQTPDSSHKPFSNIRTLADIWNQQHKLVDTFGIITAVRPIAPIPGPVAGKYFSPASLCNAPEEYMLEFAIQDPTVRTDLYVHLFSAHEADLPVIAPGMAIALAGVKVHTFGGVSLMAKEPEFFWVRYDGGARSLEGMIAMGGGREGGGVVDVDAVLRRLQDLAGQVVRVGRRG